MATVPGLRALSISLQLLASKDPPTSATEVSNPLPSSSESYEPSVPLWVGWLRSANLDAGDGTVGVESICTLTLGDRVPQRCVRNQSRRFLPSGHPPSRHCASPF